MTFIPSVTILYAGIFGLLLLILSLNIFREWVTVAAGARKESEERLRRADRAQRSFIEFVPMCLLLLFLIEAHGAPQLVLHLLGMALLAARVLHAYGAGDTKVANTLRVIGTQTTFLVLMTSSLASIYYALIPLLMTKGS